MNTPINWHNVKMVLGLAVIAIIGALSAVHVAIPGAAWIDTVVSILTIIEHATNGNGKYLARLNQ